MVETLLQINLPSPIIKIQTRLTELKKIHLYVKRDDQIHEYVSGNKWRKLKYNLENINRNQHDVVVSFGGAFSNHIYALAATCQALSLPSIGIIRGEIDLSNPTIQFCQKAGMKLFSITRDAYRLKENAPEVQGILNPYQNPVIIPEGGSNPLALYGVAEIVDEIVTSGCSTPDFIVLAAGTGGTTAGLLTSDVLTSNVLAISALQTEHLQSEILTMSNQKNGDKLSVNTSYHFGGYAKWNQELLDFIDDFEKETTIPLDHVYNGKAMYGLMDLISKNEFDPESQILFIHTGGLQGKAGLAYLQNKRK